MAGNAQPVRVDGREAGLGFLGHLVASAAEVETAEQKSVSMRAFEGVGRWQSECLATVCDLAATGSENALEHVIRINDGRNSIKVPARLTIPDDVPDIQHSLRRLMAAG